MFKTLLKLCVVLYMTVLVSAQVQAAEPRPYRITMVLYRGCEQACQGFKDYWSDHKIPVEIETLDVQSDLKKIPSFIAKIKASKPDLLVTWGTSVSLEMLGTVDNPNPEKYITDIPALFMIASTPVGSGLVQSLTSSGRNVSGTLYIVPVDTQLNVAKLYMPFKRVGFILNPLENNSKVVLEELRAAQKKFGFELIERVVPLDSAGKPDALSLPGLVQALAKEKVDFLYFAPDTFLLLNRKVITRTAVDLNLPVLATSESVVQEADALFGVVNHYYTVGQLTASKAELILAKKVRPRDIPVVAPPGFSLVVNMRVASELKNYPPIRVLKVAEIVR